MNTTSTPLPVKTLDSIRDKARNTIIGLLPDETIDELIRKEFQAFFDEPKEAFRVASGRYGEVNCLASPFRVLVWETISSYVKPRFLAQFNDETNHMKKAIDAWLVEQASPTLASDYKALVEQLAVRSSSVLLQQMMKAAASQINSTFQATNPNIPYGLSSVPFQDIFVPSLNGQ